MGITTENALAGYEDFNSRDYESLLARMTEDFSWHEAEEIPGGPQSLNTKAEFGRYLRSFGELWASIRFEVLETAEIADTFYARVVLHGRGKRSGADVALEIHHVWRLRDGRFASMRAYIDEAAAREAAGLGPGDLARDTQLSG